MIVVDIFGELIVFEYKLVVAFGFYVLFVLCDDVVIEEIVFLYGFVLKNDFFFVPDEFGVVLFALFESFGILVDYDSHFLDGTDFPQFVNVFEPAFVAHPLIRLFQLN